jgi:hypothetical protein
MHNPTGLWLKDRAETPKIIRFKKKLLYLLTGRRWADSMGKEESVGYD